MGIFIKRRAIITVAFGLAFSVVAQYADLTDCVTGWGSAPKGYFEGTPIDPKTALPFLSLTAGARVTLLGAGGEGHVYRVIEIGKPTYVVKVFDVSPATLTKVKDKNEELPARTDYYQRASDVFNKLEQSKPPGFKFVKLIGALPEHLAYKLEDVRGFDLRTAIKLNLFGKESELQKVADTYNRNGKAFTEHLKAQGWDVRLSESHTDRVGNVVFQGYLCTFRKGGPNAPERHLVIATNNIVRDPKNGDMTIIDFE